ncbi:MAG TPA: two-component regulator propeller domain-containing protein, partial [bacterium]|nr:two-component regulator propeller domain-containing protein [bacterium]
MNRIRRGLLLPILSLGLTAVPGNVGAQCDPDADWTVYQPTGEVSEIVVQGNRAWIAAAGGIIRADLGDGVETQDKITDVEGLASTDVTCMVADGFGNVWVGTREDGVTVLDADGNHVADLTSFDELYSDRVTAMGAHGERVVVVSVDDFSPSGAPEGGGFVIIEIGTDGSGFTFTPRIGGDLEVGQDVLVRGSDIWFGTSGQGLWVRDETVEPVELRQELTQADGLSSANVKKMVEAPHHDLSGDQVLWIGTGAGLQTYDPDTGSLEIVPGFETQNVL